MISSENQRFGWFVKFATVQFREEMLNLLNEVLTIKKWIVYKKKMTQTILWGMADSSNGRNRKVHHTYVVKEVAIKFDSSKLCII